MTSYTSYIKILGEGSYGDVHETKLNKTSEIVAIKRNFVRKHISFLGSIKELDFLVRLHHPNIIGIKSVYLQNPFSNVKMGRGNLEKGFKIDSIYFGMELGECDGYDVVVNKKINFRTRKKIFYDLILGLEYLHSMNIIHRDIKLTNFIKVGTQYKWCDFGMSLNHTIQDDHMTSHVTTETFRAPEIIFKCKNYNKKVDMWSMGILMMEIMTYGQACLFEIKKKKNKNVSNKKLIRIFIKYTLEEITHKKLETLYGYKHDGKIKNTIYTINSVINLNKKQIIRFNATSGSYKSFLDLMGKLIVFDPKKRLSATQALNHPFFKSKKEEIESVRTKNAHIKNYDVKIVNNVHRKRAFIYYRDLLDESCQYYWHRDRVIFHALRIYDRFLVASINTMPSSDDDILLYIQVCFYISIKLIIHDFYIPSFNELFPILGSQNKLVQKMEFYIVDTILKGQIYEDTLYEMVHEKMSSKQKNKLLSVFGSLKGQLNLKKVCDDFTAKHMTKK